MYRVYEGREGASAEVTQQEPAAMQTQGRQQKYSTDTEQPSNTREHPVTSVDWEREGPTVNVQIPLAALGPHIKAVLWLQTPATLKPPQRGLKSHICA